MARNKSSIMTAADKKQISANLKLQLKDIKAEIKSFQTDARLIEKDYKARIGAVSKALTARAKAADKLQAQLDALKA